MGEHWYALTLDVVSLRVGFSCRQECAVNFCAAIA
jgi:hypothetical protein